jgi:heat shock protein HslJ
MTRLDLGKWSFGVVLAAFSVACGGSAQSPTAVTVPPTTGGSTGSAQSSQDILGSWQAVSLIETGGHVVTIDEPTRFTADFTSDGRVALRADCNRCVGGYSTAGTGITVGPMACTKAYCSSAPLDTTFAMLVSDATAWTAAKDTLLLQGKAGLLTLRK